MAFKRILIAVDANEIALDAATVGLELAAELGAAVALVHVIESTVGDASWVAEPSIELSASTQGLMAHILTTLHDRAPIPEDIVKFEPAGAAIQSIVRTAHG
jgi:nucleotide-binding universal stress UspA family protein